MSKKIALGAVFILGFVFAFFIGLYTGGVPFRHYVEMTGGAPGIVATDLKNRTDQLLDQQGSVRGGAAIADNLKHTISINLRLAAQLYCQMPEQYRQIARNSAKRLQTTMTMVNESTERSISFLSNSTSDGKKCFNE